VRTAFEVVIALTGDEFVRRVANDVKRVVGRIIDRDLKDPRIGMTSVVAVDMSPDLKHAKILISVLDMERDEETAKLLNEARGFIRLELAQRLDLKYVPELRFAVDHSIERGARIDRLLRELKEGEEEDERP